MPDKKTKDRADEDLREGKTPSTAAGEFVKEEMHHIREGKHGARSTKQAIAIGLSKARRAGVPLEPPEKGETSEKTRKAAEKAYEAGQEKGGALRAPSRKRSRATSRALDREGDRAASRPALAKQAKRSAQERRGTPRSPKAAARRAASTRKRNRKTA
ncbi:MAG TPA: DUF6496 domain-containing protein [Verrucomicrobiae bacterium]|jgi:hypothetical protein|nr:DUF6496 domain-containing protein [Verrucomicrobiae bacterium]